MPGLEKAQWVEHYAKLERPLYNVVYRVIWDPSESQDVVQEAFLKCWQRRATIHADGFRALLFRTALNLAISRRRRSKLWRFVGLADAADEEMPEQSCEGTLPRSVRSAIGALPDRLSRVLLLTEFAGMTYAEVAAILGIEEGTVGSRRTRALEILRRRLRIEQGKDDGAR
jgi:RNA polymerase sigma-70 factor (ECF subfamily)